MVIVQLSFQVFTIIFASYVLVQCIRDEFRILRGR